MAKLFSAALIRCTILAATVSSMLCYGQVCPNPALEPGTYFILTAVKLPDKPQFCVDVPAVGNETGDPQKVQKMFCNGDDTEKITFENPDQNCFAIHAATPPHFTPFLLMFPTGDNITVQVGQLAKPSPFPKAPSVWRWFLEKVPGKEGHFYICTSDENAPHIAAGKRCWTGTGFAGDAGTFINVDPFKPGENQEWILVRFQQ
jgi:hypothetical protein